MVGGLGGGVADGDDADPADVGADTPGTGVPACCVEQPASRASPSNPAMHTRTAGADLLTVMVMPLETLKDHPGDTPIWVNLLNCP